MGKKKDVSVFKIIVKFVTPVIVLLSFIPGPNGKKLIDWSDLLPSPSTQKKVSNIIGTELPDLNVDDISNTFTETKTTVYKWKDEKGQWHFSQEKPEHLKTQKLVISNKINTIKAPPKRPTASKAKKTTAATSDANFNHIGDVYSPTRIKKLMDDAKNMQNVSDNRAATLDNL